MKLFLGNIEGGAAVLNEEESYHYTKVLRGKLGEEIFVTDGKGTLVKGVVSNVNHKKTEIQVMSIQEEFEKKDYYLHLGIAPTKNIDRIEFFLEKATEIGIDEITFLQSFNSERKNINIERCEKIVLAAMKQSLKAYLPKLNPLEKLNEFIKKDFPGDKFIAHCYDDLERSKLNQILKPKKDILIIIGPEGDFSREEVDLSVTYGFHAVSLGHQRFRTETAALQAVFSVDFINELI